MGNHKAGIIIDPRGENKETKQLLYNLGIMLKRELISRGYRSALTKESGTEGVSNATRKKRINQYDAEWTSGVYLVISLAANFNYDRNGWDAVKTGLKQIEDIRTWYQVAKEKDNTKIYNLSKSLAKECNQFFQPSNSNYIAHRIDGAYASLFRLDRYDGARKMMDEYYGYNRIYLDICNTDNKTHQKKLTNSGKDLSKLAVRLAAQIASRYDKENFAPQPTKKFMLLSGEKVQTYYTPLLGTSFKSNMKGKIGGWSKKTAEIGYIVHDLTVNGEKWYKVCFEYEYSDTPTKELGPVYGWGKNKKQNHAVWIHDDSTVRTALQDAKMSNSKFVSSGLLAKRN